MDNKKLLVIFVPVILLIFGYIVYTDYLSDEEKPVAPEETSAAFAEVKTERDTVLKNRLETFKTKWEREKGIARKVENQDDFFGEEVKDSTEQKESVEKETVIEKEAEKAGVTKEQPRVIVKYVEREKEQPKVEVREEPVVTTQPRRKAGFSSVNSASNNKSNQSSQAVGGAVSVLVAIQDNTKVKSGSTVFLRTMEATVIDGVNVPANTLISGTASLSTDRLYIVVKAFDVGGKRIIKDLSAYSTDGNKGIIVEGGVENAVKNDVANDAITTVQRSINVPILRNAPIKASKRVANDPEIPLIKGHVLYLKTE